LPRRTQRSCRVHRPLWETLRPLKDIPKDTPDLKFEMLDWPFMEEIQSISRFREGIPIGALETTVRHEPRYSYFTPYFRSLLPQVNSEGKPIAYVFFDCESTPRQNREWLDEMLKVCPPVTQEDVDSAFKDLTIDENTPMFVFDSVSPSAYAGEYTAKEVVTHA
jgi:hypothetical protein